MDNLSFKNFLLIDKKLKIKIIYQISISFLNSIIEVVNLSLLPFLIVVLLKNDTSGIEIPFVKLNIVIDKMELLIFVIVIFVIKSLFNFFAILQQEKLSLYYLKSINSSFFKSEFYYQSSKTFSEINKMLLSDSQRSSNHLRQLVIFNRELLLLLLIIVILFYRNFLFSILITSFLVLVVLIYIFFFRNIIKKWSTDDANLRSSLYQLIYNVFNFLPDIKIFNLSENIIHRFRDKIKILYKLGFKVNLVTNSSRIYFETIIFFAIIFLITFIFYNQIKVNDSLIRDLTFIVLASIRLIPSLSSLNSSYNNIKYYQNSTQTLGKIITEFKNNSNEKNNNNLSFDSLGNKELIKVENLSFSYDKEYIFKNLNFCINHNDIFLIDGSSGVGKSTLLKIIIGLLTPTTGRVILNNKFKDEKNLFSYVPQEFFLLDDNIVNNIILNSNFDQERFRKAIKISRVSEFLNFDDMIKDKDNKERNFFEKSINLSGGQKQRIAIARALYRNAKILILDEATNQIDLKLQSNIINEIIKEYKMTVIIISHDNNLKKNCTNYIILKSIK
jgi:ABC-type bacteriocin/lantibiotic exporter with double-glycine peptidase domain